MGGRLDWGELDRKGELTDPYASLGCLCIPIANARHAVEFFIKKHYVGDLAQLGTFLADVLLDVKDSGGIFLQRPTVSAWQRVMAMLAGKGC